MNNIKRSILALTFITALVMVGCEEDGSFQEPQREPYDPSAPAEKEFAPPSGIGSPDNTTGSGGDNREGYPSKKDYNPESSTNQLF